MGIRIEQPGAAKAAAAAGTIIGKGQRAEEDRARAEREQARANAEAAQKQARQDEMKFALQKRQEDWQRSLAKERRQEDYQVAAEDRAVERGLVAADYTAQKALERIEFSKDLDHQYKAQEQQKKQQSVDTRQAALDKETDPATGHSSKEDLHIMIKQSEIDSDQEYLDLGRTRRSMTTEEILALQLRDGGGATGVGGVPGESKPLTDVGGFPLPVPTPNTLTAQHVHASKAQQGKAFVVDKHTNTLQQVPLENEAELLELARYERPKITGAPVTKPRRTRTGEMDPTGMIEAFDVMKPNMFNF